MKKFAAVLVFIAISIVITGVFVYASINHPMKLTVIDVSPAMQKLDGYVKSNATEIEKTTVLRCTYVSGVARETQNIRINTKHDYERFKHEVSLMYVHDDGLDQLLVIAKQVFTKFDSTDSADYVGRAMFDECYDFYTKGDSA